LLLFHSSLISLFDQSEVQNFDQNAPKIMTYFIHEIYFRMATWQVLTTNAKTIFHLGVSNLGRAYSQLVGHLSHTSEDSYWKNINKYSEDTEHPRKYQKNEKQIAMK